MYEKICRRHASQRNQAWLKPGYLFYKLVLGSNRIQFLVAPTANKRTGITLEQLEDLSEMLRLMTKQKSQANTQDLKFIHCIWKSISWWTAAKTNSGQAMRTRMPPIYTHCRFWAWFGVLVLMSWGMRRGAERGRSSSAPPLFTLMVSRC